MKPAGCQLSQHLGVSLRGAKQLLPLPEPCGDCGYRQALFISQCVFHVKGKKKRKKEHCEFEDQSHYLRVLYILSQELAIWFLVAVKCLRCIEVV